ncbi:MAG TPA: glycosyltransferase family 2 protein [bacterium]|nr:glycosyltransferase family 2 protein [bacterium]
MHTRDEPSRPGGGASAQPPDRKPRVSVVVPVRNEVRYIEACLGRLLDQDYPRDRIEILVVDGMSQDGTRETVERVRAATVRGAGGEAPVIRLIDNPTRQRASALNAGIRASAGDVVVRVDARSVIPRTYVGQCVRTLLETGADNVGGVQRPLADAPMQEAIGIAMAHPFGIGNAQFRLGRKSGYVDTVYLGSFRREVFDRVGLFDDVAPVLSEDSDINQRIRERGGKIYLNIDICVHYYPRETLGDLCRLYFRYGGARAGNLIKHGKLTSWRQAVPPAFLAAVVTLGSVALVHRTFLPGFGVLLAGYGACDLAVSGYLAGNRRRWHLWPRLAAVFPCVHISWALGFFRRFCERSRTGRFWSD